MWGVERVKKEAALLALFTGIEDGRRRQISARWDRGGGGGLGLGFREGVLRTSRKPIYGPDVEAEAGPGRRTAARVGVQDGFVRCDARRRVTGGPGVAARERGVL